MTNKEITDKEITYRGIDW